MERQSVRDPLHDNIPLLLRRTSRFFRLAIQDQMRPRGLGYSHWIFLRSLWVEDLITQRELCKRIGSTEPAAVIALSQLERTGYIQRSRNRTDMRQILLSVTPKGVELRDQLLPFAVELIKWSIKDVRKEDLKTFKSVLRQIEANMASALGDKLKYAKEI